MVTTREVLTDVQLVVDYGDSYDYMRTTPGGQHRQSFRRRCPPLCQDPHPHITPGEFDAASIISR